MWKNHFNFLVFVAAVLLLAISETGKSEASDCVPATFIGAFDGEVTLCQNWDSQEQQEFWFTAQGSRIIPYDWFLALEQSDNQEPFASNRLFERFLYLPQKPTPLNPEGLPIGFTKDTIGSDDPYFDISSNWLGMTCAACHTGQVEHNGAKLLIDGAPAMADFERFMWSLSDALTATANDPQKFERFMEKLKEVSGLSNIETSKLKGDLAKIANVRSDWNDMNRGEHDYGFGRLDAIGAIFNSVAVTAQGLDSSQASHRANAPVSYPFIWDTPQHDYVQWNASVANEGAGALGRNVGEVLGVFGDLKYNPIDGDFSQCLEENASFLDRVGSFFANLIGGIDENICIGHHSSIKAGGLSRLEELLWDLKSPKWPDEVFGEPNDNLEDGQTQSMVARGKLLFENRCLDCHDGRNKDSQLTAQFDRDDPGRKIEAAKVSISKVKTDPGMAENFVKRAYPTVAEIEGQPKSFIHLSFPPKKEDFFQENGTGGEFVSYAVRGVIVNKILNDPENAIDAIIIGKNEKETAFLEALKQKLVEARTSNNIQRIRILFDAIEEAEERSLIDWLEGINDNAKGQLRKKLRELISQNKKQLPDGISDAQKQAAIKRLMVYKARPLNGIWATGPYLHNGSVRTIRQLMLPAACPENGAELDANTGMRQCRQKTFRVGTRTYDLSGLGFADEGEFLFDTSLKGNHNTGHEFSTKFFRANPRELDALIEYIKTL